MIEDTKKKSKNSKAVDWDKTWLAQSAEFE